jgi:hypothetical protein
MATLPELIKNEIINDPAGVGYATVNNEGKLALLKQSYYADYSPAMKKVSKDATVKQVAQPRLVTILEAYNAENEGSEVDVAATLGDISADDLAEILK